MSVSIFDSKNVVPDDRMLAFELGETSIFLDTIRNFIITEYSDMHPEWKFYGQKSGWVLKLLTKKRNVLFGVPFRGYFNAVFTFGERATDEVIGSSLPDLIKCELVAAKKYSEGRTIQLDVKSEEQCNYILELIRIKMKN